MNEAWSRGIDLVRDNFQLLLVISGVFLLLPSLAAYILLPDFQAMMDPAADPDLIFQLLSENAGSLIAIGSIAAILQFAGYGAMIALMSDSRPTVGEALKKGFLIVPSIVAALAFFIVSYAVGAMGIMIPFSLLASLIGSQPLASIGVIPVLIFVAWLAARMSMSMPALALGQSLNPVTAVAHSFRLTKPKQWRILIFWLVISIVYFIIALLAGGVLGVVAAMAGSGPTTVIMVGLTNGLMGMAIGMVICGVTVAIYSQLSGANPMKIKDTFK